MPELWRLRALATGLGADVEEVKRLAAIQWLDYDVEQVRVGEDMIMIPLRRPVSDATRRRIQKIAEALAEEEL
ncbi:hypothetical protein [Streptosporangium saharense]|uniref:hypothetical protein n=1 Tax=Streptosporangium saharense TaxID=1706840 RepID=UPI00332230A9